MSPKTELYPLKFHPIFKEKIWGGKKLKKILGKKIPSGTTGESWEISDVEENVSVVGLGKLAGKNLRELIKTYRHDLMGKKVYEKFGNRFPLLIKFIDAKENLSVQLHPDDLLARKRHDSFGKTEMWYVLQADKNAEIIAGFKENITEEMYRKHLRQKTLPHILNFEPAKKGDVFFVQPGLIHAIGGGVLLAEIQQTSDVTYRVYDWDRKNSKGKKRELHVDLAVDAIDFSRKVNPKVVYSDTRNSVELAKNPYFSTKLLSISEKKELDYCRTDSFVILICVEGSAVVETNGVSVSLKTGGTILLPAIFNKVVLKGKAKLLEVMA